jgi:hypothetical protein
MNSMLGHTIRIGFAAVLSVAFTGSAMARPDTRTMTCAQVQNLIERSGAIVLTTGRHTYDRYVTGFRYCERPYVPTATSVPTRDTRHCPVYNCQRYDPPLLEP